MPTHNRLSALALSCLGVILALAFAFSMNSEDAWVLSFQLSICVLLTALLFVGWLLAISYAMRREGGGLLRPLHQTDSSTSG
ncbi:hypothetical protein [Cupriavidus pinatubonensis]|uniref:Transmembrane protein n=1 Tax=Cupriavidus pinatubonensis TaxID=248026 RepID=A0ABM8XTF0_9BURK|nr:hypothetical protein [Cupriavidus pinatubonensis]CAG9183622.1 hypothetical protein LMG23994_05192 [Cupriavidus pinatubonensis]